MIPEPAPGNRVAPRSVSRSGEGTVESAQAVAPTNEDLEIRLLLRAVYERHGYDFRRYSPPTVARRLRDLVSVLSLEHVCDLIPLVLHDEAVLDRFLSHMSVPVTEMFRDPAFFKTLREAVFPLLDTGSFIKIWFAGCATGEEVYSTAIALHEEGCFGQAHLYATDCNPRVLDRARAGIYDSKRMQGYAENYRHAGGKALLSNYFHAGFGAAKVRDFLKQNVTFARHDLATDGVFSEVNVVLCRNVLIYFDRVLQARALSLFAESLCRNGYLCLGTSESIEFSPVVDEFRPLHGRLKIYRKVQ